ncbi:MAG: PEP-CTERM sorting domain-containing protein [Pseudomonadota bacterium]
MTHRSSLPTALYCVLWALAWSPTAFAGLLYSTSYEAPPYAIGPLDGQEGWANSFGIDPIVTSGFARTGTQSLEVRQGAGEDPFGLTFRDGPYSTSAPKVSVKHSVYLDDTDVWDFISPMALGGDNGFIAQLAIIDGLTANLGLDGVSPVGVPISTERWIDLELVLDFPTQTVEGFVDGVSIGSGAFANPTEQLSRIEIFHIFDFTSTGPSNSFFVDDLTISAVPLPSTVFLVLGGLLALVGRRELVGE